MKSDEIVQIGNCQFAANTLTLSDRSGQHVPLRRQSCEVLRYLSLRPGEIVSKHEVLGSIWPDTHVTDASLVQCIKDIREALGAENRDLLETVPRRGYRLNATASPSSLHDAIAPDPLGKALFGVQCR